jgi:hypothetical protein
VSARLCCVIWGPALGEERKVVLVYSRVLPRCAEDGEDHLRLFGAACGEMSRGDFPKAMVYYRYAVCGGALWSCIAQLAVNVIFISVPVLSLCRERRASKSIK